MVLKVNIEKLRDVCVAKERHDVTISNIEFDIFGTHKTKTKSNSKIDSLLIQIWKGGNNLFRFRKQILFFIFLLLDSKLVLKQHICSADCK